MEKIEIPCKGQTDFYLDVFLKTKGVSSLQDTGRFVSEFEEQIRTIINSRENDEEDEDIERKPDVDPSGMMLFCRFHSFLYSLDIDGDISKINLFVQQFSIFLKNIYFGKKRRIPLITGLTCSFIKYKAHTFSSNYKHIL